jgi:hypothetical protein
MTVKHESKTGNDRRTYDLTSLLGREPRHGPTTPDPGDPADEELPDRYRATTESDWNDLID